MCINEDVLLPFHVVYHHGGVGFIYTLSGHGTNIRAVLL